MSKTFNGFASDRELTVKGYDDSSQVDLLVRRSPTGFGVTGIAIAPSDAAALALAVLEAAGYVANSADVGVQPGESCDDHFWDAAEILRAGIAIQAETEAKDKAELEAEALELHNAFWDGMGRNQIDSWGDESGNAKQSWIAAARRAREMRTEK